MNLLGGIEIRIVRGEGGKKIEEKREEELSRGEVTRSDKEIEEWKSNEKKQNPKRSLECHILLMCHWRLFRKSAPKSYVYSGGHT